MKVVLVYNAKSGNGLTASILRKKCKHASIEITALIPFDDHVAQKLTRHINAKAVIAVVGGDGTLSRIAGLLTGSSATLAPLPGGTLNHFTKDLGIPQDIDEALHTLARSSVHKIDVGMVNARVFINNSSIGLYPHSLRTRDQFESTFGKWPAAVIASVRALIRFRTYNVTINGETFRTPFVFVGNNDYTLEGLGGPARARLDKGVLSIFVAKTTTRGTLLKIALFTLIGRAKELDEFDAYHASHLTIHAHGRSLNVSRDGEIDRMTMPLRYEIKAGSLRVRY